MLAPEAATGWGQTNKVLQLENFNLGGEGAWALALCKLGGRIASQKKKNKMGELQRDVKGKM